MGKDIVPTKTDRAIGWKSQGRSFWTGLEIILHRSVRKEIA
jgi:hypothetical protein